MFDLDQDELVVGTHFHMNGFAKCVLTESKGNLEMAGFGSLPRTLLAPPISLLYPIFLIEIPKISRL